MPDGRLLNRDDLDAAFPDNPVRVDHVSMHGGVVNSLALKKYGISAATKTPPGGVIVRKPGTEEPWGLIMETAFLPVFEQSEPITAQREIDWTRAGQILFAEAGVTTAHEGATHLPVDAGSLRHDRHDPGQPTSSGRSPVATGSQLPPPGSSKSACVTL